MLAAGSIPACATTLVAIWAPDKLLIGADSNVILNASNEPGSACKIWQDGSTFYAFSGLVEDQGVHYDAASLAHEALQEAGDLSVRLNHFLDLTRDPLNKAMGALKNDSPDQYRYLQQDHPVLQVIFAEVKPGPATLGIASFALAPDGNVVGFSKIVARGDDGQGARIIYAGQQKQIRAYLRDHRDWSAADPSLLLRNLIQSEINASNGEVGGPIDIVSIEPNSAHWLQKKAECK